MITKQSRGRSGYNEERAGYSLPMDAFRVSALTGALGSSYAGVSNSPLDSHPVAPVTCLGVEVGIDYYTVCYDVEYPMQEIDTLEKLIGCVFDCSFMGSVSDNVSATYRIKGSFGVMLEFSPVVGGTFRTRVTLGGQYLKSHSCSKFLELAVYFSDQKGYSPTRVDIRADDKSGTLSLSEIHGFLSRGDYSGFRGGEFMQSYGGANAGSTVYFGGRKSNVRLRFYDKAAESNLQYPCIRQELQLRAARAVEAMNAIVKINKESELWQYVASRLSGSIAFGARKGKNLERMLRAASWTKWQELLVTAPIFKQSLGVPQSIDRTLRWFARTASKALSKIKMVMGSEKSDEFLEILTAYGTGRLRSHEVAECASAVLEFDPDFVFEGYSKYLEMVQ